MALVQLALPVPPPSMGTSWTGVSLLNWVIENSDGPIHAALVKMSQDVEGHVFMAIFDEKAKELNERFAARSSDGSSAPEDKDAGRIVLPGGLN